VNWNRDLRDETKALNQISIQAIGGWLGVKLPARGSVRCPFEDHEDSHPSFEVKKTENRWVCYGCGRSGGSIDFVMVYNGIGFAEAKQWLAARTRITAVSVRSKIFAEKKSMLKVLRVDDEFDSAADQAIYEALLKLSPLQSSGREYLNRRALSDKTIEAFRVGQLINGQKIIGELLEKYGYDRLKRAGLLTKKSFNQNVRCIFPNDCLLFPFLEKGDVAYLQARLIRGNQSRGKWRNLNYLGRRVYNVEVLERGSGPIAICEGIMDTLSAVEMGFDSIGLMGVSAKLTVDQISLLRGREVNILLDWDGPGEARSLKLQKELRQFGIASTRKKKPSAHAKDLNEYLMEKKG